MLKITTLHRNTRCVSSARIVRSLCLSNPVQPSITSSGHEYITKEAYLVMRHTRACTYYQLRELNLVTDRAPTISRMFL